MSKRLNTCLRLLLVMVAGANVLLIRQNLQMRRAIERLEPQRLKAGERVRPFRAPWMNGEHSELYGRRAEARPALADRHLHLLPTARTLLARIDGAL